MLDSSLSQWNLDSGFPSLVGFQIPQAKFAAFWNPDFLIWGVRKEVTMKSLFLVLRKRLPFLRDSRTRHFSQD